MTTPSLATTPESNGSSSKGKFSLKLAIRVLLICAFITIFIWFFFTHKAEFSVLSHVPWYLLLLIGLAQFGGIIITNVFFQITLLQIYDIKMPWWESFVVIVKSSVINFFGFLQGGAGYRAYYLKKNYGVNYARFALLFAANYLIVFFICALFGLVGSLLQATYDHHPANYGVVGFFAASAIGLLGLMLINPAILPAKSKLMVRVKNVLGEWGHITSNRRRLFILFLIGVIQFWFLAISFFLELRAIHASTTVAGLMVYSAVAGFSILVAFTPAAIGFRETLLIFSKQALGISVSLILVTAVIDRLIYFILLGVLLLLVQRGTASFLRRFRNA